jgi:hypothetical protein
VCQVIRKFVWHWRKGLNCNALFLKLNAWCRDPVQSIALAVSRLEHSLFYWSERLGMHILKVSCTFFSVTSGVNFCLSSLSCEVRCLSIEKEETNWKAGCLRRYLVQIILKLYIICWKG